MLLPDEGGRLTQGNVFGGVEFKVDPFFYRGDSFWDDGVGWRKHGLDGSLMGFVGGWWFAVLFMHYMDLCDSESMIIMN